MRRAVLAFLAALLVLAALGPAPASAASGSITDPSNDAGARIDITRLKVQNGDHRVNFELDVRDLRKRGQFSFDYWGGTSGNPPARSAIVVVRYNGGDIKARLYVCDTEECPQEPCQGLTAEWKRAADVVTASLPQRCYPRPAANPDAPAPSVGRFFAYGSLNDHYDELDGQVTVQRG
ncbi:hypothetical protein [Nocardioides stalactiti]|uniref:hypothetical protein n=1 Tax=Nocardioides stalactiti TaxID=2755356 RepID=UPI00160056CC|nr:hypothetical protein [Nocardioides stalactiti]